MRGGGRRKINKQSKNGFFLLNFESWLIFFNFSLKTEIYFFNFKKQQFDN